MTAPFQRSLTSPTKVGSKTARTTFECPRRRAVPTGLRTYPSSETAAVTRRFVSSLIVWDSLPLST